MGGAGTNSFTTDGSIPNVVFRGRQRNEHVLGKRGQRDFDWGRWSAQRLHGHRAGKLHDSRWRSGQLGGLAGYVGRHCPGADRDEADHSHNLGSRACTSPPRRSVPRPSLPVVVIAPGVRAASVARWLTSTTRARASGPPPRSRVARQAIAATTVGTKAIFAGGLGGITNSGISNVVDIYDASTGKWSTATLSQARYGLAATTVGTKAIFAGGYNATAAEQRG